MLVIIQTYFQIEIINLFSIALKNLESQKVNLLYENGTLMLIYTIFSMISIFTISFLSIKVSSKIAYNTRKKIFHILMNLPDEELNKFKITALITRSTRGVFSEQGFIILLLEHFLIIPFVFIAVVIKIAFIDKTFAGLFAIFIIILFVILIFRLKQITNIF